MTEIWNGDLTCFYALGNSDGPRLTATPLETNSHIYTLTGKNDQYYGELNLEGTADIKDIDLIGPYMIKQIEELLGRKDTVVVFPKRYPYICKDP